MRLRLLAVSAILIATASTAVSKSQLLLSRATRPSFDAFERGAVCDGTLRPLSTRFSTLAQAQAQYPFATDLAQSVDWAGIQSAIRDAQASGGGEVFVGAGKCTLNAPIDITVSNVTLTGAGRPATILDFGSLGSGSGVRIGPVFDFGVRDLQIQGGALDNLAIATGEVPGDHTNGAYGAIRNVAVRNARTGTGLAAGNVWMLRIANVRAQRNATEGFRFTGFSTTLAITDSHALSNGGDGWRFENVSYSSASALGADNNGGYGYFFQDVSGFEFQGGAEKNAKAMFGINYAKASKSPVKGVRGLSIKSCYSMDNNAGAISAGYFAEFKSDSPSTPAGRVSIRSCQQHGAPSGASVALTGQWKLDWGPNQDIGQTFTGGSFSAVGDGATDALNGLPVHVAAGGTPICSLGPKARNGVAAMGGLVLVYASNANVASSARGASYVLAVADNVGTGAQVSVVSAQGNTTGATPTDASFAFSYNPATKRLMATPVGATATGNWYFSIATIGNITVISR